MHVSVAARLERTTTATLRAENGFQSSNLVTFWKLPYRCQTREVVWCWRAAHQPTAPQWPPTGDSWCACELAPALDKQRKLRHIFRYSDARTPGVPWIHRHGTRERECGIHKQRLAVALTMTSEDAGGVFVGASQ